jgi:hypothetical protein
MCQIHFKVLIERLGTYVKLTLYACALAACFKLRSKGRTWCCSCEVQRGCDGGGAEDAFLLCVTL